LNTTQTIVLTESLARKYFEGESAVGKYLKFQGTTNLLVTAVMKDIPLNTHFQFDALVSFRTLDQIYDPGAPQRWHWYWNPCLDLLIIERCQRCTCSASIDACLRKKIFPRLRPQ